MVRFALQISELYLCIRRTFRKSEWRTKKSERIGLSDEQSLIDLSSSGTFFSFLYGLHKFPFPEIYFTLNTASRSHFISQFPILLTDSPQP